MSLENPQIEQAPTFVSTINHQEEIEHFITAQHAALIGEEALTNAKEKAILAEQNIREQLSNESGVGKEISYNKYKKSLMIGNEEVTLGQLVASRHFDETIRIPEVTAKTFEGKRLQNAYTEYSVRDVITDNLNKDLATVLAEKAKREDMFKSKAYVAIAERSGTAGSNTTENGEETATQENKQLGVVAEKIMQGIAEMITLDRPDLHLSIRPANAYQDVEEKIDFIISTRTKRRGVGVETNSEMAAEGNSESDYEEKNFGIQFTVNASKTLHKMEQIEKAKERATDVDDILLVTIDQNIIRNALRDWEEHGRSMHGPWQYMAGASREKIIETLFNGVLQPEEIESVKKGF